MFGKPIILFLVALCLFQVLQGGLSGRLPRSTEGDSSGNLLQDFDRLLNETFQLDNMMRNLNSSLASLGKALDEVGETLSSALNNATRTLNSNVPDGQA
ncbi:hypothetical protein C0J52_10195 [Blattella germanica]|nr:hypothetical protein C0J52_10195 [Blattella germanica]